MIKKLTPWLLMLCATPGYALKSDGHKLAHIHADSVQYSNKTGIAKYVGHVNATQGTTRIEAEQLELYRNKNNEIAKIIARGQPAHYSTQPDEQPERFHANANTIEYNPTQGKIELIDNALAIIGKNRFSGPHIHYDINQQVIETDASPKGQTTIVIEPHPSKHKSPS